LITGRTLYHFHTRTKTARAPQLQDAAPEVWVEVSKADARRLGINEGDLVEVSTPRGSISAAARISGIRDGVLFVPFHYGYFDADGKDGHHRAGNELTVSDWDPASKQPIFKTAAAQLAGQS
jgi:anaerobic selenocysteine-containing dehydrogenase